MLDVVEAVDGRANAVGHAVEERHGVLRVRGAATRGPPVFALVRALSHKHTRAYSHDTPLCVRSMVSCGSTARVRRQPVRASGYGVRFSKSGNKITQLRPESLIELNQTEQWAIDTRQFGLGVDGECVVEVETKSLRRRRITQSRAAEHRHACALHCTSTAIATFPPAFSATGRGSHLELVLTQVQQREVPAVCGHARRAE